MKIQNPHNHNLQELFRQTGSGYEGLTLADAAKRLASQGPNIFPSKPPARFFQLFLRQFLNPLIYILFLAALISGILGDLTDAFFIGAVLFVNALIGGIQELGSEKSARALQKMTVTKTIVIREGQDFEVNSENLVVGDLVRLESGRKVSADLRLVNSHSLEIDESLLTGESVPVVKDPHMNLTVETPLADRINLAFTGSLVTKGRAQGLVVATGLETELGKIASDLTFGESARPPLLIRMDVFTKKISIFLVVVSVIIAGVLIFQGQSWHEVLLFSVALAVSAIPEGLPVALTVTLSIASRRMARRNVIVRELPAVEALGSCNFIATDKTGTLTVNQMTIQRIALPDGSILEASGSGLDPSGSIRPESNSRQDFLSLVLAGCLCNESKLFHKGGSWSGHGDAVDLAFQVLAHKTHLPVQEIENSYNLQREVPYEPLNQFAASLHHHNSVGLISVKGAFEKILSMCSTMRIKEGDQPLDHDSLSQQADQMAEDGFRVMALAMGIEKLPDAPLDVQLKDLVFLGLVGMIDPLRPEAASAIASCKRAGIEVAMVTGDHPKTSLAIAKQLGLALDMSEVVSGPQLKQLNSDEKIKWIQKARVFARVEPQQKLEIVRTLLVLGRFVAVTGDGANDAPALKAANVGVAMGRAGTDVAKEASDLILTDDRFASIVAGIEEGRIAYSNIRKVVYLLITTGAAEIFMFVLSILYKTPLPLIAVQLLWLNLVTNGIQHVGLAFEPGEGDELMKPARRPNEPIIDRLMLERVVISALVIGGVSFWHFHFLIENGANLKQAQNLTLLLMVLFENIMVGNCRSETKSAFALHPLRNPVLFIGTLAAQGLHIVAMYIPGFRDVLGLEPVSFGMWMKLLLISLSVLFVVEIYKLLRGKKWV